MGSNGRRGFNPYLTMMEVAELLHVSVKQVDELIRARKLPYEPVKDGSPRCIPLEDVNALIESTGR